MAWEECHTHSKILQYLSLHSASTLAVLPNLIVRTAHLPTSLIRAGRLGSWCLRA